MNCRTLALALVVFASGLLALNSGARARAQASPTPGASGPAGHLTFHDDQGRSDQARLDVTGLPAAGTEIVAWLTATGGETLRIGTLSPDASGAATLTYTDPQRRNLIAQFDGVLVTAEPHAGAKQPDGTQLIAARLPAGALAPLRQLLVRGEGTPNGTAFASGLQEQAAVGADHGNLAKQAVTAGDMAATRLHLEHIVNIVEGSKGAHFGDLNGDGKITNPGDGFGLLVYAAAAAQAAQAAAEAAPGDAALKAGAAQIAAISRNVTARAAEARDAALPLFQVTDLTAMRGPVDGIALALTQALNGRDDNGDGRIDPATEGGARAAYTMVQSMASMSLSPVAAGSGAAPAAPTSPATATVSTGASGTRLVVISVVVTALILAALIAGAWYTTGRRPARAA